MRVGRIQPDSPIAGAITRSAPTSSDRVRPRTRVSPARSAIATNESAAGHRPPALQSMARTTPCLARHLAGQADGHDLGHAPVHEAAAVPDEGREDAGEAARGPHRVAQAALAEDDALAGVHVGRQDHHRHAQAVEGGHRAGTRRSARPAGCRRAAPRPSPAPTSRGGGARPGPRAARGRPRRPRRRPPAPPRSRPAIPATGTPSRSSARRTPAWAAAWAPPPDSAR